MRPTLEGHELSLYHEGAANDLDRLVEQCPLVESATSRGTESPHAENVEAGVTFLDAQEAKHHVNNTEESDALPGARRKTESVVLCGLDG